MERCPNCWKLFPVHELPLHSPICQDAASKKINLSKTTSSSFSSSPPSSSFREPEPAVPFSDITSKRSPSMSMDDLSTGTKECLEQCPHCLDLFPLEILISHAETCSMASTSGSTPSSSDVGRPISRASTGASDEAPAAPLPISVLRDTSMEQCPYCSELLPITELITHCAACGGGESTTALPTPGTTATTSTEFEAMADIERDSVAAKRARYTLEPFDRSAVAVSPLSSIDSTRWSLDGPSASGGGGGRVESASRGAAVAVMDGGKREPRSLCWSADGVDELEQCVYCLKEFPISELVHHAASCSAAAKAEVQMYKYTNFEILFYATI